jgi:hypothetical protein
MSSHPPSSIIQRQWLPHYPFLTYEYGTLAIEVWLFLNWASAQNSSVRIAYYVDEKSMATLKDKQTSITTVLDIQKQPSSRPLLLLIVHYL